MRVRFYSLMFAVAFLLVFTTGVPSPWRVASASTVLNLLLTTEDRIAEIRQSAPNQEDDFQTNSGLWELFYEGDAAGFLRTGAYHVTIDVEDTVAWGDSELEASNFYLEVDIVHPGDALESEAGVLFRYVDVDNFYFYSISNDGYYKLNMLVDNEWQSVVNATKSSAIDTADEAVNRLGILVEGDQTSLLVNDLLLDEIEDTTLSGTEISLAAGSFDDAGIDVTFDDLSFWNLDSRQLPAVQDTGALIAIIRAGEPVFQDNFSRITNAWDLDATDDIISSYDDRELHVRVIRPDWSSYGGLDLTLDDFLFEVDTKHVDGPTLGQYGIYFRNVDGENYYYFAIDATGEYSLWKLVDNDWETILDWAQSDVINSGAGAENRLGVLAQGSDLALLANDEILVEIADDTLASGAMGVFVATFDEGDVEIAFDNVDVWDLASGEPEDATPASTPAPTPTPTPVPALSPTPTATPDVGRGGVSDLVTEVRAANPTYHDNFDNDETWETESSDEIEVFFADEALHIRMIPEGRLGWSSTDQELADFLLEFDVAHAEGPDDAEAGVMFRRVDDLNYLLYAINPTGSYRLDRRVGGEWETLVSWTPSDALQTGVDAINRLGVLAEGDHITLYANDFILTTVEDDTFIKGGLALTVGTFDHGDAEAVFDNLVIWNLVPPEQVTPTPSPTSTLDTGVQEDRLDRVDAITAEEPTYRDTFDGDDNWDIQSTEDVEYSLAGGELTIRVIPEELIGWSERDLEVADFYLEVDITHVDGPPGFEAGLIFRMIDNQNYYLYVVDDVGNYRFDRRAGGDWETLVDWTESSVLQIGDNPINRLGILAEGDRIALFANDTLLTEVEDDILTMGTVAAEVGTFDEGDAKASFDNLAVWSLSPPLQSSPTPSPATISDSGAADTKERVEDIQASDPTFRDNFSRDTGAWTMTSSDDASMSYRRRAFYILINRDNWLAWSSHERDVQNFLVTADTQRIAGPLDAGYGMVFRSVDDENQYIFRINGLGEYSLWKTIDDEWFDLFDWTQSDTIDTNDGAVNRIGVLAEGPHISLIINDSVVAQVEDDSLSSGVTGLVTGAYDDPGIEVAFDNVDLWDLSQ